MAIMDKKTFVEGIVVGAVAGVVTGLLLAAKSGRETLDEITTDLTEIKDKIVERVETLADFTQEKYEEAVKAAIAEYSATNKLSAEQAKELEARLQDGYEAIRKTIHEHTAVVKPAKKA
jgi:gas vesicle protein